MESSSIEADLSRPLAIVFLRASLRLEAAFGGDGEGIDVWED
jgi:hypothetical protein